MANNAALNCPPRMSDGRSFTNYANRCSISDVWRGKTTNMQMSSNDARKYLIANATSIMESNRDTAERNNNCGSCFGLNESGTMLPELEMQICNKRTCAFPINDNMGLGLGRQVEDTLPRVHDGLWHPAAGV